MSALFQPFAEDDRHGGVGATRDDMRAFVNIARSGSSGTTSKTEFSLISLA